MAEVGVDGVAGDARLDDAGAQFAEREDFLQALVADTASDLLQVMADARHDLPAVAPGAAETQVAGFEHDDVGHTFFGQFQRRVDAGKPTTDDHHIRLDVMFQSGVVQVVLFGRAVIGRAFEGDHDAACRMGVVIGLFRKRTGTCGH
ncbi:hypothetical protein D3C80_1666210 [compost metagenome]